MRRREFYQTRKPWWDWSESTKRGFLRSHHCKFMAGLFLFFAFWFWLFDFPFAWSSGCNGDAPILAGCSRVSLRAEPCGNCPEPPDCWLVTIDHHKQIIMPNMAIVGEEGMWIPLGDYYRLHPGDNLIEYRAAKAGYVDGPTESVVLSRGTEIPLQTLGAYTISEVRGEGN